jgi:hypothetical protein
VKALSSNSSTAEKKKETEKDRSVAHTPFIPATWEAQVGGSRFEASLSEK